jgi:hypothetical protein
MSWFFFPAQKFPGLSAWSRGFKDKLTHQQVADLANWMRAVWGGQDATFKPGAGRRIDRPRQAGCDGPKK